LIGAAGRAAGGSGAAANPPSATLLAAVTHGEPSKAMPAGILARSRATNPARFEVAKRGGELELQAPAAPRWRPL
jgi:hypothetical protein